MLRATCPYSLPLIPWTAAPRGPVETKAMTSTLVLIASGILIGAGLSVIWRDIRRSRRKPAFVLQRPVTSYCAAST